MWKWIKRLLNKKKVEISKIDDSVFFRQVLDGLSNPNFMLTEQEANQIAEVFLAGKGSPLAGAWEKVLKFCLISHQWEISHLSSNIMGTEKAEKVSFIQGRIAQVESLLQLPRTYIQIAERNKDNKK
jgi:hypothetical protein